MSQISDSRPSARHQPKLRKHGHGAGVSRIVACLLPSFHRYQLFILFGNRECEHMGANNLSRVVT